MTKSSFLLEQNTRPSDNQDGENMLGPIGSELMSIFRLLSPDEMDRYIVENKVKKIEGVMAASGDQLSYDSQTHSSVNYSGSDDQENNEKSDSEEIDVENQAKIIPLHAFKDPPPGEGDDRVEKRVENFSKVSPGENSKIQNPTQTTTPKGTLGSIGILSAAQIRQQEQARLAKEKEKEDSITVFLLKERDKMRRSKQKIVEQSAIQIYKSSAAVELNLDESVDEEEGSSAVDMRGILINKRQF